MSIGKTLLKVAIGVVVAKGVASLTKGSSGGSAGPAPTGRGTRIGTRSKGGLEDMMGDILGSGRASGTRRPANGGMGDLLGQISGRKRQSPRPTAPKGGLDGLWGELTGHGSGPVAGRAGGGVGDLLDQVLADRPGGPGGPVVLPEPEREKELSAALMLRAVIQAVKCDGELDDAERARLVEAMDGATPREAQAVQAELQRPVDVQGLAQSVPAGLEPQVYMVSLMAIDLDHRAEADYLHQLAGALDLSPDEVNAMHDQAGAPRLYR